MRLGISMRFRIRRANITPELRDNFELFGVQVVALALGLGVMRTSGMGGSNSYMTNIVLGNQGAAKKNATKVDVARRFSSGVCLYSQPLLQSALGLLLGPLSRHTAV